MALPDFVAGGVDGHDIWTEVVHLLLKLYPEEDVTEARAQPLHAAHLRKTEEKQKKQTSEEGELRKKVSGKEKSESIINLKQTGTVARGPPPHINSI